MKQMKKNSKQIRETVGSSVYILSGNLEVKDQDLPKEVGLFYFELDSRILSIQDNEVSSMSFNNPDKFVVEIRERIEQNDSDVLAIISSEDEKKVVHVEKFKVVRRNGKRVLRMTASVEELEVSGKYAGNSVNLNLPEGEVTLILQMWDPGYGLIG
jgi:hypothetical protein